MSYNSASLTATGSATLTKRLEENAVLVAVDGTYGTVQFKFQATIDGSNWIDVAAIPSDTQALVAGGTTISPTDNAELSWIIPNMAGYSAVRANVSAIASGTFGVGLTGMIINGLPFVNVANTAGTQGGDLTFADAKNIILNTTTGTKIGTGTTQKLGFYNATPVVQRSAYTQTYSTADKTHANPTATALTDNSAGTANTTLQALADGTTYANDVAAIRNNFADLAASNNAIIVDLADLKQLVNSIIDDLQALGLAA